MIPDAVGVLDLYAMNYVSALPFMANMVLADNEPSRVLARERFPIGASSNQRRRSGGGDDDDDDVDDK